MSLRRRAASGVRWMFVHSSAGAALGIVQIAVLARTLGPGEFGLLAILAITTGLFQMFADLGTTYAVIQRREPTEGELSSLYCLRIAGGAAVFVLAALSAFVVPAVFDSPLLKTLIPLAAVSFVVSPLGSMHELLLRRRLKFDRIVSFDLTSLAAGTAVTVFAVLSGHGVFSPVWGHIAAASLKAALFAGFSGTGFRPRLHLSRKELSGYLGFGRYQMGERALVYLSTNVDKLLISRLLGMEALGYYSVAYQIAMRPYALINPVVTGVAFPLFSAIQEDAAKLKRAALKTVASIAFVNAPLYFGLFAAARPFITVFLGEGWGHSVGLFQILIWLGLLYGIGEPVGSILLAKGQARLTFWLNLFCLAGYAVAIAVGSLWGLTGIALALVLTQSLFFAAVELRMVDRVAGIAPLEYLKASSSYAGISLLMALTLIAAGAFSGIESPALRLLFLALLGMFIYALGIAAFKRQEVGRMFRDMGAGAAG